MRSLTNGKIFNQMVKYLTYGQKIKLTIKKINQSLNIIHELSLI